MPRQPSLAILFAGVLAATLIPAGREATAQGTYDTASRLLRPTLDGRPTTPPRFQLVQGIDRPGFVPDYRYRAGFGAGSTGFDSTNIRRRKVVRGVRASRVSGAGLRPLPISLAAPLPGLEVPLIPRQLQAATVPIPGRIYFPNRPGAPPPSPDLATLTVASLPPILRPPLELRPFDPLGIQVGAFNLRPGFEYLRGYDNNVPRNTAPPQVSSWFNIYAPDFLLLSNWARHELTASLRGTYTTYDTAHAYDRPNMDARANARIDVTGHTRIDLEGRYLLYTDNPGSPNIQVDLARFPIAMTYGATAGVGHRFNRLDVSFKGVFDRTVYNDSEFIDGSTSSNADRNYNNFGARFRAAFEVMPGAVPFLELGADTRKYDLPVDAGGMNRSSQGYRARIGTTLELRPKVAGEVSVGYLTRAYEDPTLEAIRGWTVDASLVWLASALTTVKLIAATGVQESTIPGVSGSFTRDLILQMDHAFRRWLVGTLRFARGLDDYVGSPREDLRYVASAAIVYWATRELQLKGEYRQDWRFSNIPGNDYWAHVWLVGLRLQR